MVEKIVVFWSNPLKVGIRQYLRLRALTTLTELLNRVWMREKTHLFIMRFPGIGAPPKVPAANKENMSIYISGLPLDITEQDLGKIYI